MYFFFYALLTAALFLFSGIGLAILMTPRVFEKYSLYFSPFAGLAYMSFCSWFLFAYSAWGTDQYAPYLLVPPLLFLAIAAIVKKDRIVPILFPFTKEHLMVLFICVILFLSIAYPYYSKVEGVSNTITLGNNDIVDYAATSKYLTTSSLTHPQIISPFDRISPSSTGEPPSPRLRFPESLQKNYFSAYLATAIPASLFGLETYQLQNLVLYLFFVFSLPLVYLLSVEIFGYSRNMALCSALLVGINFNLLYLVYEGFLGQIIGMGFFLCLFLTMYYPLSAYETPMIPSGIGLSGLKTRDMFSCQKCNGFFPFLPLSVLFLYGLCMSYEPLIPFIFLTLGIFLVMYSLRYPSRTRVFHALSFLLLTIFFTFLISPLTFIDRLHQTFFLSVSSGGLDLPFLYPDGIFGLNVYSLLSQSTPAIITVALSVVALIAVLVSFDRMYKENYQLFSLALASVVLVLFVYSFYSLQEAMSPSFSGDGYKAYKVMTYFIPILVLSALYYWKDLRLSTLAGGYDSKKIFSCGVIFLFIVGNLCSAGVMIAASTHQSKQIDEGIIDLKRVHALENVSSINIEETGHWNQMWMYYFLMGNKPVSLKHTTYWNATPLDGEWTLHSNLDVINVTLRNDPIRINDCCSLEKNVIFNATFGEGWYYPESNETLRWRWTGATNDTSSLILYLAEAQQIDLDLSYWSLNSTDALAVLIDSTPLQVCSERNHCRISGINLTSGTHILTLKTKLASRPAGERDTRTLSYAYSDITFSKSA